MTQDPENNDTQWRDFLSPRYSGPSFDEAPNRRARAKQRKLWEKEQRRGRSEDFVESLQEQRREAPTSPVVMIAALVILAAIFALVTWVLPALLNGRDDQQAAAPAVTVTEPAPETTSSAPSETRATSPAITAEDPEPLAEQWLTSYLTREAASDDAWQESVREHTTEGLMSELENTSWPDNSPFTDCTTLKLDSLSFVDAPRNTPADTPTRWTRVANTSTVCNGEPLEVPFVVQVVQDDGRWKIGQAVEMDTENRG